MISFINGLINEFEKDGRLYHLNMSFDNIIQINEIQNDLTKEDVEQLLIGARLLFLNFDDILKVTSIETILMDFQAIYIELVSTVEEEQTEYDLLGNPMPKLSLDDDEDEDEGNGAEYCFVRDADYIYSSFIMDYNINLMDYRGKMHWHEFRALVNGLSDNTIFRKILSIRGMELPKDANERDKVKKQKKKYALKSRK